MPSRMQRRHTKNLERLSAPHPSYGQRVEQVPDPPIDDRTLPTVETEQRTSAAGSHEMEAYRLQLAAVDPHNESHRKIQVSPGDNRTQQLEDAKLPRSRLRASAQELRNNTRSNSVRRAHESTLNKHAKRERREELRQRHLELWLGRLGFDHRDGRVDAEEVELRPCIREDAYSDVEGRRRSVNWTPSSSHSAVGVAINRERAVRDHPDEFSRRCAELIEKSKLRGVRVNEDPYYAMKEQESNLRRAETQRKVDVQKLQSAQIEAAMRKDSEHQETELRMSQLEAKLRQHREATAMLEAEMQQSDKRAARRAASQSVSQSGTTQPCAEGCMRLQDMSKTKQESRYPDQEIEWDAIHKPVEKDPIPVRRSSAGTRGGQMMQSSAQHVASVAAKSRKLEVDSRPLSSQSVTPAAHSSACRVRSAEDKLKQGGRPLRDLELKQKFSACNFRSTQLGWAPAREVPSSGGSSASSTRTRSTIPSLSSDKTRSDSELTPCNRAERESRESPSLQPHSRNFARAASPARKVMPDSRATGCASESAAPCSAGSSSSTSNTSSRRDVISQPEVHQGHADASGARLADEIQRSTERASQRSAELRSSTSTCGTKTVIRSKDIMAVVHVSAPESSLQQMRGRTYHVHDRVPVSEVRSASVCDEMNISVCPAREGREKQNLFKTVTRVCVYSSAPQMLPQGHCDCNHIQPKPGTESTSRLTTSVHRVFSSVPILHTGPEDMGLQHASDASLGENEPCDSVFGIPGLSQIGTVHACTALAKVICTRPEILAPSNAHLRGTDRPNYTVPILFKFRTGMHGLPVKQGLPIESGFLGTNVVSDMYRLHISRPRDRDGGGSPGILDLPNSGKAGSLLGECPPTTSGEARCSDEPEQMQLLSIARCDEHVNTAGESDTDSLTTDECQHIRVRYDGDVCIVRDATVHDEHSEAADLQCSGRHALERERKACRLTVSDTAVRYSVDVDQRRWKGQSRDRVSAGSADPQDNFLLHSVELFVKNFPLRQILGPDIAHKQTAHRGQREYYCGHRK
ncbi:hypothetical protein GGX14DRAFT_399255 [Mycena pura]|uniref:Uncharacterized protein n=1 Tax=Mycena pura TaxID=153505 RepID=A0AAD6YAU6_9AGAR|nr:hypothetical protein GGX14DRAFT_399255 [Mycena pura]